MEEINNPEELSWKFDRKFIDKLNEIFNGIYEKLDELESKIDDLEGEVEYDQARIRELGWDVESLEGRIP